MSKNSVFATSIFILSSLTLAAFIVLARQHRRLEDHEHRVQALGSGRRGAESGVPAPDPLLGRKPAAPSAADQLADLEQRVQSLEQAPPGGSEPRRPRNPQAFLNLLKGLSQARIPLELKDLIREGDVATLEALLAGLNDLAHFRLQIR